MDKRILDKYLICNQSMVTATDADQILLDLKQCLNQCLDNLSMLYLSYTDIAGSSSTRGIERVEPGLRLAAQLDEKNSIRISYETPLTNAETYIHGKNKNLNICKREEQIISLLEDDELNSDPALQATLANYLPGVVSKGYALFCFPACVPLAIPDARNESANKRIWCLLVCAENKNNEDYVAENSNMILVLVNLVFSHIARIEALEKLKKENDWIQDELKQIATLQRLLLPGDDIKIKGADTAANFRACEHAGGDYYDMTVLSELMETSDAPNNEDFWGTMIADSAGHGAAAAVEISMFDAILRTINDKNTSIGEGPAGVFTYANQYLFTRLIRGTFITAFIAGYNPANEEIIYASAGHPPALLYRSSTQEVIELDQSKGIPLGVVKEYAWENYFVPFKKNDIFLMYTDGIIEASNFDGQQFGLERVKKLLLDKHLSSSNDILGQIESAVDDFQKTETRKDDQTLVVIKRT